MKRFMKSAFVIVAVCLAIAGNLSAQDLSSSFDTCLPPTSDGNVNADDRPLTYRPPPPIGQSIDVNECRFLPERSEALGKVFLIMQCSISNRSEERVASFNYGVRYLAAGNSTVLKEVGFEGEQRFGTALLVPILLPQETQSLRLVASDLPTDVVTADLDISVEVISVRTPDGRILR
ncbi:MULTISPECIES: hypothetical protein [unclassified Phaeobacter]|uniref:hypothetical protein n=1 Tax=unclassified Phaeobacter TaxID=2621772 RepID=UPI003A8BA11A